MMKNFENLQLPVIVAPMFLVSSPSMVVESCKSGVVGTFPALNQRTNQGYESWLDQIEEGIGDSGVPYGVNLIVHKSNPRLAEDLASTVKYKVPLVITSLGTASEVVEAVHSYGGKVFHDVTNVRFAEKALKANVDGLIAVCAGAGGHAGTYNPFAFISELRSLTDKMIVAAGCVSNGGGILASLACGADLAYMGTRFIASRESSANDAYREMLIRSTASDIVYTPKISGVPANFLVPSIEGAGIDLEGLNTPNLEVDREVDSQAKAWIDILSAGHGVGSIKKVEELSEIVEKLKLEYHAARLRLLSVPSTI